MVSLFSACYDLAFCISGTLRLTDWKPVSQTLLVFSGTFSYLVRSNASTPFPISLICSSNKQPHRPVPPSPGEEMIPREQPKTHVDVSPCGTPKQMLCEGSLREQLDHLRELKRVRERVANVTRGGNQVDAYPLYAASSLAANALARCSFAAGELMTPSHTGAGRTAGQPASRPAIQPFQPAPPPLSRSAGKLLDERSPNRALIRPGRRVRPFFVGRI